MFEVGLANASGSMIVPRLPAEFIVGLVNSSVTTYSGGFGATVSVLYYFPFCSNLQAVMETASYTGGYRLTGQESLKYIPNVSQNASVAIFVTSYDYVKLLVKNNQLTMANGAVA